MTLYDIKHGLVVTENDDYDLDYSEEREWNITSGEETFSGTERQRLRLRRYVNQLSIEQNSDHTPVESNSARKVCSRYIRRYHVIVFRAQPLSINDQEKKTE